MASGLLGSERLAQKQIARSPPPAGEPRKQQRARGLGHKRKVDERHRETRAFVGDHQIAVKQHGRADADAIAVNRGDDRRFAVASARSSRHTGISLVAAGARLQEIGEVVAGGEVLALAADGDHSDAVVIFGRCSIASARARVHGDSDRVAPFRPSERDRQDAALLVRPAHARSSPPPRIG